LCKQQKLSFTSNACVTAMSVISYVRAGQLIKYQLPGHVSSINCQGVRGGMPPPPHSRPRAGSAT